jgi:hypothetical protein
MNRTRDFNRAVDRWLDDGSDATPPEVIDAVLLAVRSTPQERDFRIPWRTSSMTYLRVAAVFVTIAVAGLAAFYAFGSGLNVGSGPTPSAAEPSIAGDGGLPVGPHVMVSSVGPAEERVTVTISEPGWYAGPDEASVTKDDGEGYPVTVVTVPGDHYQVPENICNWQAASDLVPSDEPVGGLRAHELLLYLSQQTHDADGSLRDLSAPADITIDGQPGNSVTGVLPSDPLACDEQRFCSLLDQDGAQCLLLHERNQIVTLWISDSPDKNLWVVAATHWPTTSPDLLAEVNAIIESMR